MGAVDAMGDALWHVAETVRYCRQPLTTNIVIGYTTQTINYFLNQKRSK